MRDLRSRMFFAAVVAPVLLAACSSEDGEAEVTGTGGTGGATGGAGGATGGTGGATGGTGGATGGTGGATGGTGGGGAPPSCQGLSSTCGPASNESCCTSPTVPGGTFKRSYDGVTYTDQGYPATVSDFRLDKYEITVGRFRKFVAAYTQAMTAAGAGKNPNNASDPGWSTSWNASLPASASALTAAVKCDATNQTWTDSPGGNEARPMNCINWYEAFAFCIWDGGRLPTEAEWNYAAAGGSEQRVYPWSSPASSSAIDASYAVYTGSGSTANVGSKGPKADGKWGQADLAGNVWEWDLDWYASPYSNPCNNCANTTVASVRMFRGGSFYNGASYLLASNRGVNTPTNHFDFIGARCARTP